VEVRILLEVLAGKLTDCRERLDAQAVSHALHGLQNMSSDYSEVRTLLGVLAVKVLDSQEKLDAQGVSNALYGLQSLNSECTEVQTLLGVLVGKVTDCQDKFTAQQISNALYGFQSMHSEHTEVRTLLSALAVKITTDCQVVFSAAHSGYVLYGLQGMTCEHTEVQQILAILKVKLLPCFDKNTSEHSDVDLLHLLRSFVLYRPCIVSILGVDSEALCSEYHRKLDDELITRKQRGDAYFVQAQFMTATASENVVYSRVEALASELQLTDLRQNVYFLDCLEGDIQFTVRDKKGEEMVVNVEIDGSGYEQKRKKMFGQLRDQELMSKGIHVVRITTTKDTEEIDDILRKTVEQLCHPSSHR
jgi:hypothetical protein